MKTNKKTERSSSPNCLPAKRDLEKDENGGSSVQRLVRQFWGFFFGYSCMCGDLEKVNKWLNKKAGIYRGLYDKKGKIHYSFDWPGLFGLTKYKVNLS